MPSIIHYKCPACTGPLHYAGASGMLECDYCGSRFPVAEIEAQQKPAEQAAQESFQQQQEQQRELGSQTKFCLCPS